jgi:hypothetical protein
MRWLVILVFAACTSNGAVKHKPDLSGPYACGRATCTSGQICVTESAGSQCWVNADAGIGPYDEVSAMCVDLPVACDGIPSCDCVSGQGLCFGAGDREVDYGCI